MWSTVDNILVLIDLFWTSIEFLKIHMFTLFLNYVYLNAVPLEVLILTLFLRSFNFKIHDSQQLPKYRATMCLEPKPC